MTNKTHDIESQYSYVFSEGSTAILNAHDSLENKKNIESYSWKQVKVNDMIISDDDLNLHDQFFSFTAPYVKGNQINTKLYFQLITTYKDGHTTQHDVNVIVKRVFRAMIFQGGVALGAYEAGVFRALVEKLIEEDKNKRSRGLQYEKRPLFDIVAGTSIGGMNGAIVISNVTRKDKLWEDNESWGDSAKKVIEFWKAQQKDWPTVADTLDIYPIYRYWWDLMHTTGKASKHSVSSLIDVYSNFVSSLIDVYSNLNPYFKIGYDFWMNSLPVYSTFLRDYIVDGWYIPATAESARRYYSAMQFKNSGAPQVASGIPPWSMFGKFFDFSDKLNPMPRADNKHFVSYSLKKTLERFVHYPIKTKEGQPRFLVVTVDVQTGDAVTFDSYSNHVKYHNDENSLRYDKGIEIEHILASGTFPDFFDYPRFKVNNHEIDERNKEHIFWDGGFRSNTPLREVIQAHRDYWHKTRKQLGQEEEKDGNDELENNVPDLEVYIADLWPSNLKEEPISFDRDFVENRKLGILFNDKTDYDEQIANVITDYIDLVKELRNLAQRKGASKDDEIKYILNKHASSINTKGQTRIYEELLRGRFRLTRVVRIDHKDDGHDVANKIFDYSYKTIENLMEYGYKDAMIYMDMQYIKEGLVELANKYGFHIKKGKDKYIEKIEERFHDIQESIKNQTSYNTIVSNVDKFISEVENMEKQNEIELLQKEKISLISAAKQFKETLKNITNQQNLLSLNSMAN